MNSSGKKRDKGESKFKFVKKKWEKEVEVKETRKKLSQH